eukprot:280121_1
MSMSEFREMLAFESTSHTVNKIIDVSSIIDELHPEEDRYLYMLPLFKISDITSSICLITYYETDQNQNDGVMDYGLCLKFEPSNENAVPELKVACSIKCGQNKRAISVPLCNSPKYKAFRPIFDAETIRKYKKIHISIHLYDKTDNEPITETSQTFEQQLHKMWEISNKTGDTKLIVKIQNNNNDLESYDLYSPPHKKVRIDTSNNSNKVSMCWRTH